MLPQRARLYAPNDLQLPLVNLFLKVFDITAGGIAHASVQGLQLIQSLDVLLLHTDVHVEVLTFLLEHPQSEYFDIAFLWVEADTANSDDKEVLHNGLDEDQACLQVHSPILQLVNEDQANLHINGGNDHAEAEEELQILLIQLPLYVPLEAAVDPCIPISIHCLDALPILSSSLSTLDVSQVYRTGIGIIACVHIGYPRILFDLYAPRRVSHCDLWILFDLGALLPFQLPAG